MCMNIYVHTKIYRDNSNIIFFPMGKKRQIDLEEILGSWHCLTKAYKGKIKKTPNKKSVPQAIRLKQSRGS